jgi:ABC-type glutathione transport system ATPase component
MEKLLSVQGLQTHIATHAGTLRAVDGVDLHVMPGEAVALVGESGSGKTTTGRCLVRLLEPTSGGIHFDGQDVMAMPPREFRRLRPRIQMVFQEPYDSLSPRMRIGRQIAEPLRMLRDLTTAERDARKIIALAVERVDIAPEDVEQVLI